MGSKYLAIGVAAGTGILARTTQYAAIREGQALLVDLKSVTKPSALGKKISEPVLLFSEQYLENE
jgi:hypothetical protein